MEKAEIAKLKELVRVVSSKDERIASLKSELEAAKEKLLLSEGNDKGKLKNVWRTTCQ